MASRSVGSWTLTDMVVLSCVSRLRRRSPRTTRPPGAEVQLLNLRCRAVAVALAIVFVTAGALPLRAPRSSRSSVHTTDVEAGSDINEATKSLRHEAAQRLASGRLPTGTLM